MWTLKNPADFASRVLDVKQQDKVKKLVQGPELLWTDEILWSPEQVQTEMHIDDSELKK